MNTHHHYQLVALPENNEMINNLEITFKHGVTLYKVIFENRLVAYIQFFITNSPKNIFIFGIDVIEKRRHHATNIITALPYLIGSDDPNEFENIQAYCIDTPTAYSFWTSLNAQFIGFKKATPFEKVFEKQTSALFYIPLKSTN